MGIRVKVSEWGNSLAIRLPKAVVEQLNLSAGKDAEFVIEGDRVTFVPRAKTVQERHNDMIAEMKRLIAMGVKPPEPVDWGPDIGGEILPDEDWSEEIAAWEKAQRDAE